MKYENEPQTPSPRLISNEAARNFLVNYQGLGESGRFEGREGAKRYLERVRCIQFDPLNVVGRNPDLVLQSRVRGYRPEILQELLYEERFLVDGADKVQSIILMEDFPKMMRVRKAVTEELRGVLDRRGSSEALGLLDEVREYIRENGPQPANKVNIGGRAEKGGWGHSKISSAALDYLNQSGELGIRTKRKTQKVYDLAERLYPSEILGSGDPFDTVHEFLKWYVKRRVGSVGMVRGKTSGAWLWYYIYNRSPREEIIRELVEEGELLEVSVEGARDTYYIRREDEGFLKVDAPDTKVRFIAPLDNLIWDRGATEELFHFSYSWEVYTPAAKRQYGYYVLPVLCGNRFIARFEPEKNDGKSPLRIKNWWWEPDVAVTDELVGVIGEALREFCEYLGVPTPDDAEWQGALR
ncbi:MAG: YcaQ family DNA glycosylase [Lachnospiraceae bacterium]|nr:YcaQ family DNA glycosylase [Lachnospiraceae bacterium]